MTVVYTHDVATGSRPFGNFRRLLLRWRGSIYQLVWPELFVYVVLYYTVSIGYRFGLKNQPNSHVGKKYFHLLVDYADKFSSLIPLQFVLGFYVSQVLTRWWNQFMICPWPDSMAVTVASTMRGRDERGRLMRRTILRYMNTGLTMIFTMISPQVRIRFPTLDDLVQAGLLVPHEKLIMDHLNEKTPGPKYFVPFVWAGAVAVKARKEGRITDDVSLYAIIKQICQFRSQAQILLSYDWVNIPLVYTQVATLCTYIYFLSCLFGKQFIDTSAAGSAADMDIFFPVFLFLEYSFMLGWLKVAETMINPFGEDDDDIEVNYLVDRNLALSYLIVDEMHNDFPEMLKDAFWEPGIPDELMYTPEALKYKTDGMGSGSAAPKEKEKEKAVEDEITTTELAASPSKPLLNTLSQGDLLESGGGGAGGGVVNYTDEFISQLLEKKNVQKYEDPDEISLEVEDKHK